MLSGLAAILAVMGCLALSGCFQASPSELRVQVSQVAPYPNAPKAPDCNMEVLRTEPTVRYTRIAIVEGWAGVEQGDELLDDLRRKACQTGADALLVLETAGQVTPLHLYRATPNDLSEEVSSGANLEPGHYLHKEEHIPKIGEPGHSGYYVDAVAIVYDHDRR